MVTATTNTASPADRPISAANAPLPPLSQASAALFAAWLDERGDLTRIAARLARPPHEVLTDLRSAPLADYIAAAETVAERALRRRGLNQLAHVMESSPDLAEQRRAATALVQALNRDQRTRPDPRAARETPPPAEESPAPVRRAPRPRGGACPPRRAPVLGPTPPRADGTPEGTPFDDHDRIEDLTERLTERLAEHLDESVAEDLAEDLAEDILLDDQTDYARHILEVVQADPDAYPPHVVHAARVLVEPPPDPPARPP